MKAVGVFAVMPSLAVAGGDCPFTKYHRNVEGDCAVCDKSPWYDSDHKCTCGPSGDDWITEDQVVECTPSLEAACCQSDPAYAAQCASCDVNPNCPSCCSCRSTPSLEATGQCNEVQDGAGMKMVTTDTPCGSYSGCAPEGGANCMWCIYDMSKCVSIFGTASCNSNLDAMRAKGVSCSAEVETMLHAVAEGPCCQNDPAYAAQCASCDVNPNCPSCCSCALEVASSTCAGEFANGGAYPGNACDWTDGSGYHDGCGISKPCDGQSCTTPYGKGCNHGSAANTCGIDVNGHCVYSGVGTSATSV